MSISKKQKIYLAIIFSTIIDICLLAYITFYPVSNILKYHVLSFDFIICIVLWIEFIYSYLHSDDRRQYLKENTLSILGMLPLNFFFLRALRLIRLIQLIKLFVLARDGEKSVAKFLHQT